MELQIETSVRDHNTPIIMAKIKRGEDLMIPAAGENAEPLDLSDISDKNAKQYRYKGTLCKKNSLAVSHQVKPTLAL